MNDFIIAANALESARQLERDIHEAARMTPDHARDALLYVSAGPNIPWPTALENGFMAASAPAQGVPDPTVIPLERRRDRDYFVTPSEYSRQPDTTYASALEAAYYGYDDDMPFRRPYQSAGWALHTKTPLAAAPIVPLYFPFSSMQLILHRDKCHTTRPVMGGVSFTVGQIIQVKEDYDTFTDNGGNRVVYAADFPGLVWDWKDGREMPIELSSVALKVEAAQTWHLLNLVLDAEFLRKEGILMSFPYGRSYSDRYYEDILDEAKMLYLRRWDKMFGDTEYASENNPKVWAIEFSLLAALDRRGRFSSISPIPEDWEE